MTSNLYGLYQCFRMAGQHKGKTPFERMLDDIFAQIMIELMCEIAMKRSVVFMRVAKKCGTLRNVSKWQVVLLIVRQDMSDVW